MNQLATQPDRIPMDSVGVSNTSTGTKIAPQNLGEVVKFAEVMCRADIALPKHLRGNAGACMAVAMQALEWQMSPFAVASKSYAVNGAIAYEAQLIAAVVNTRSGIKGRLRYQFDGEGSALTCTVTGMLDGSECNYTSPPIGSITTKNSPLWKSDPQQQLGYFAARSWARRHCPEVILGVYDRDEADDFRGPDRAKDITNQVVVDPFSDEPIPASQSVTDEQYDADTGEIFTNTETGSYPSPEPEADDNAPSSSAEGSETPSSGPSTNPERDLLIRYAKDVLHLAASKGTTGAVLSAIEKGYATDEFPALTDAGREKAKAISRSMRAIFNNETSLQSALEYFSDVLECPVEDLGG